MLFLITLPAISRLMRGSTLKRSSYSGGVESVEVFASYGYRAASDAPTERGGKVQSSNARRLAMLASATASSLASSF